MNPPRTTAASLVAALLISGLIGCAPAESPSTSVPPSTVATAAPSSTVSGPTVEPSLDRAGWRADLALLVPGMAAIHPNLTHGTSRGDLDAAVNALSATVDASTDDQLMVGVLRIVAMVSRAGCDAHTGSFIWGTGTYPVDSLPLRLWLFEGEDGDEVVVVDALPPYEDLVGSRIDSVETHSIADVIAAIDPIVPRDNAQTVRLLMPRFLLIPQVLRGLGLADGGQISLAVTAVDGTSSTIDVEPVPMARYNAWAGPYGLHLPADRDVRYLSRIDDVLWWERLSDFETLFVQYNRAEHLQAAPLADLAAALRGPDLARVILDLRHNFGGELTALDPIQALFEDPAVGQDDRLFVLTGRNTFSGGSLLVARLDANTGAVIVGEAMGGCPTIWSDPSDVSLPHSGLVVSVADDVAIGVAADDPRLTIEPDVPAILTREDWGDGRDPALALIVASAPVTDPGTSLLFDVFALNQAVGRLLAAALRDGPLTPAEYAVYSAVFELEAASPTQLATRLGVRLTTFMDQLRLMEARGHARRVGHPTDRRSYRVVLSAAGQEAHRAANRLFEHADEAFRANLPRGETAAKMGLLAVRSAAEAALAAMATVASPRRPVGRAG